MIAGCRRIVHRVIELTGLPDLIPVFSTREQAEQYLRAASPPKGAADDRHRT